MIIIYCQQKLSIVFGSEEIVLYFNLNLKADVLNETFLVKITMYKDILVLI